MQALRSNTTASDNTAVGYHAAYTNTTGSEITAVGRRSLYLNTTGSQNIAVGGQSLTSNTTGSSNTGIGYAALGLNTTASNNTAVGYQAGFSNTTGIYNTFIGAYAGYTSNVSGNALNVCIGVNSGYSLTTGTSNSFLGVEAGYSVTTGTKNTIIGRYTGNNGGLDIRTSSNYIVLSDGDGNPRQIIDSSGNAGIGVVPSANITKSLEIGYAGAGFVGDSSSLNINVTANLVNASGGWKYAASGKSALLQVGAGAGRIETYTVTTTGSAGSAVTFTTGPYVANGGTSWTSASDERLKNITGEISNALNKVSQLRAAEYTWKADLDSKPQIGLIAQDLLNVLPEAVVLPENEIDEKGKQQYMGVNYDSVIPLLVKAIQELKAEVDSLKQQLGK
jgi:hypothetical protein